MNQEQGKESKEGFKASYAGSKAASSYRPPVRSTALEGMGDVSGHKRESLGYKKEKDSAGGVSRASQESEEGRDG